MIKDQKDCPVRGSIKSVDKSATLPSPEKARSSNAVIPQQDLRAVANNVFDMHIQNHPWAFGAFAELIQNPVDAGSKHLKIDYHHADGEMPEMLTLEDNGKGMTSESISWCFELGSNRGERAQDDSIAGQYGVGFKQGVLRLGHTAFVISRSNTERCISMGVLSNWPYEGMAPLHTRPPICRYTTLELNGKDRVGQRFSGDAITCELIGLVKGLHERWVGIELGKRIHGEPGTTVYIFGVEHRGTRYSTTQKMEIVDRCEMPDIRLRKGAGFYQRASSRQKWAHLGIPMESSLREYLKILFFKPGMKISLLGKEVQANKSMLDAIPGHETMGIRAGAESPRSGATPIIGYIGISDWHKDKRLCGVFFYTANCLIKSYDFDFNWVKTQDTRFHGVIMLVNLKKQHLKVLPNKQDYEEEADYPALLTKASELIESFALRTERVDPSEVQANCNYDVFEGWVQCTACQKWRLGDDEFCKKYDSGDIVFTCNMHEPVVEEAKVLGIEHNVCNVPDDYEQMKKGKLARGQLNGEDLVWMTPTCPSESQGASSSETFEGSPAKKAGIHMASASNKTTAMQKAPVQNLAASGPKMFIRDTDYTVDTEKRLGKGRFARVYTGKWQGQDVAVKLFRKCVQQNEFEKTFSKERVASELTVNRFPNIIYYKGFDFEHKAIVMELIDGGKNLRGLMDSDILPSTAQRLEITRQVSHGVKDLHSLNLIHRDLKPENVLCSADLSVVKVADFGVSKLVSNTDSANTELSKFLTVDYCAPEQEAWSGATSLTPAVDMWALGLIILEMCVCEDRKQDRKRLWADDGGSNLPPEQITAKKKEFLRKSTEQPMSHPHYLEKMLPRVGTLMQTKGLTKVAELVRDLLQPKPEDRRSAAQCINTLDLAFNELRWEQCHGKTTVFHTLEPADIWSRKTGSLTRKCRGKLESELDLKHHVQNGSNDYFCSRFLSCSLNFDFCVHYYQVQLLHMNQKKQHTFDGRVIVEIDVNKVPAAIKRIDLSNQYLAQNHLNGIQAVNSAVCAKEIVFDLGPSHEKENGKFVYTNKIPKEAIVNVYDMNAAHKPGGPHSAQLNRLAAGPTRSYKLSNFKEWNDLLRTDQILHVNDLWQKIKESSTVDESRMEGVREKCARHDYWTGDESSGNGTNGGGRGFGGSVDGGGASSGKGVGSVSKRSRQASSEGGAEKRKRAEAGASTKSNARK